MSGFIPRWVELAARLGLDADAARPIGEDLAARHREPHRHYHTTAHVEAVIDHLGELDAVTPVTLAAAFFHDAVYDPTRTDNETRSADLARRVLAPIGARIDVDHVATIIEATASHRPETAADDSEMAAFLDADLAILGAEPEAYESYRGQIRREYLHLDQPTWVAGRLAVLESFVDRDRLFVTSVAAARWAAQARTNLRGEIARLKAAV